MLMGLPRSCSALGMFAEAHIDCFDTIMRKRCASLVRRVLASSSGLLRVLAGRTVSTCAIAAWLRVNQRATDGAMPGDLDLYVIKSEMRISVEE
ncbi:jg17620 [Pararge aegeria aegeria]|uniref:Jg17620 protein n=1 Tax=Pararge aegeria aegeria TaxID=348720 RepID=A0A8S4R5W7_9NEOP|nr:jg17620 [Pararge aegeria aegeria]